MGDDRLVEAVTISTPRAALRARPDDALVARLRAGDARAFEAIYDRYHRELLGFCRHMVGNREEAEDVLQHVMLAAHGTLADGDQRIHLRPWLYAIARNRCVSVLRARRDSVALEAVAEPTGEGLALEEEVQRREDLRAMLADLARLPDEQRAALLLAELGALTHDEIAESLGVRRDKVKALVFQAREALSGWREAREADCSVIREELAVQRGGALRRGPLRRHLDVCEGCRGFRDEVHRQRDAMALLLPVVPSLALKASILGAIASGGATAGTTIAAAGIAGGAAAAPAGTAVSGSVLGAGLTAKVLAIAAVAGVAGGGYVVVRDEFSGQRAPARRAVPAARPEQAPPTVAPSSPSDSPHGTPARKSATARRQARRRARQARRGAARRPAHAGAGPAQGRTQHQAQGRTQHQAQGRTQHQAQGRTQHQAQGRTQHQAQGRTQHQAQGKTVPSTPRPPAPRPEPPARGPGPQSTPAPGAAAGSGPADPAEVPAAPGAPRSPPVAEATAPAPRP